MLTADGGTELKVIVIVVGHLRSLKRDRVAWPRQESIVCVCRCVVVYSTLCAAGWLYCDARTWVDSCVVVLLPVVLSLCSRRRTAVHMASDTAFHIRDELVFGGKKGNV